MRYSLFRSFFFCVDEEVVVVPSLLFIQHGNSKYSTIAVVKAVVLKTILIRIVYVEKTSVLTTSWNRKTRPNNKSNIIGSSKNNNFHLVRRRYPMTIEKLMAFVINSTKKKSSWKMFSITLPSHQVMQSKQFLFDDFIMSCETKRNDENCVGKLKTMS